MPTKNSDTEPLQWGARPKLGARGGETGCGEAGQGEAGYNLVVLTVMLTVLNIALAAALPRWSVQIQREREEELIFRGLQYAEAIHQFNKRFQRLPVRLEELLEVEPRHVRQLWTNPMREDGRWALIFEGTGNGRNPARPNSPPGRQPPRQDDEDDPSSPGRPGNEPVIVLSGSDDDGLTQVASGPIRGVYSPTDEDSIKTWFDSNSISDWKFTYDLLGGGPRRGGGGGGGDAQQARLPGQQQQLPINAGRIGRPFPPGVQPQGGGQLGGQIPGRPRGTRPGSAGGPGGQAVDGINQNENGGGASPGQGRNLN